MTLQYIQFDQFVASVEQLLRKEYKCSRGDALNFDPLLLDMGFIHLTLVQLMFMFTIKPTYTVTHAKNLPIPLCMAPYVKPQSFPLHSIHTICILFGEITVYILQRPAGSKVYFLGSAISFLDFIISSTISQVMFFRVDFLRRSKQERLLRLDCGERQINETAQQLMRSSFVEIVLCAQFCFTDLKSVFGSGVWGFAYQQWIPWRMSHREMLLLKVCVRLYETERGRPGGMKVNLSSYRGVGADAQ